MAVRKIRQDVLSTYFELLLIDLIVLSSYTELIYGEAAMTPTLKKHSNGYYYVHWMEGRRTKRLTTKHKDELRAAVFLGNFILDEWAHKIFGRTMYSSEPVKYAESILHKSRQTVKDTCNVIPLSGTMRRTSHC